jgi:transglutaminase-like putative cysteine protease
MVTVGGALRAFALPSFTRGRPIGEAAMELTNRIHDEFTFDAEATTIATPVGEVLENKRGVCQDFAHLQIAACARSVSPRAMSAAICAPFRRPGTASAWSEPTSRMPGCRSGAAKTAGWTWTRPTGGQGHPT